MPSELVGQRNFLDIIKGVTGVILLALLAFLLGSSVAQAATTKVGNGDDGRDLEGAAPIRSGPIVDARKAAVELAKTLKLQGVAGLGLLIPEIERTELYMAKMNSQAAGDEENGRFHSDIKGYVYARTFAEPHAATRFFPISEKLDQEQLVALHIHEALHRALPPSVREDENKVSQITLSITAPGATQDSVERRVSRLVPNDDRDGIYAGSASPGASSNGAVLQNKYPIPEDASIRRPTTFRYFYRSFNFEKSKDNLGAYNSLQGISSNFYPFGDDSDAWGFGIELSWINQGTEKKETLTGPFNLSVRKRLWSARGFDIGLWGVGSFNTLSDEKLKENPYSRDVVSLGLSASREDGFFYIDNSIGYTSPGKSSLKVAGQTYNFEFGSVLTASVRPGFKVLRGLKVGGFGEIYLLDQFRMKGPEFEDEGTGRTQLIAVGPEIEWNTQRFTMGVNGRFLISKSEEDANLGWMGNIMGPGLGNSSVGAHIGLNF